MNDRYTLLLGDSRVRLRDLPDNSVDSCVCDPPYALDSIVKRFGGEDAAPSRTKEGADGAFARASAGFMNQAWDTGETAFNPEFWREVYRVLKPGAYLVAFGGSRTYHRLACAIEDAGFMIEDMIAWLYGSGMPKSHKPSIYLERRLCERRVDADGSISWHYVDDGEECRSAPPFRNPAANAWWGYGTALKPGLEPVCMAQKPLIGSIADNVEAFQVGALNIDACRIPVDGGEGRWPANVAHDGSAEVLAAFPVAPGMKASVGPDNDSDRTVGIYNPMGGRTSHAPRDNGGSAARFFYGSKASRGDREEGCDQLPAGVLARSNAAQAAADDGDVAEEGRGAFNVARTRKNNHPTVKPTDLMQWLCQLVTPQGGLILDPFMGSGSTGKAAMLEGFRFIGIEREEPFFAIAEARIGHAAMRRDVNPPQADLFAAEAL